MFEKGRFNRYRNDNSPKANIYQKKIFMEWMNRCQFRNFVFRRLKTDSSDFSPLDLDKVRSDIISTCSANAGLTYTTSLSTIDTGGGGSGWKYYSSILAPNGIIYVIPWDSTSIILLDTNTDNYSTVGAGTSKRFSSGALSPDLRYMYLSPGTSNDLYKLDLNTNELYKYGQVNTGSSAEFRYMSAITAPNGKIYMGSSAGLGMLEIDPTNDSFTVYYSGTSIIQDIDYRLFLDQDGNLLSSKWGYIYKFDTIAKTFTQVASTSYSYTDYNMGPDGNYYGLGRYAGGASSLAKLLYTGQFGTPVTLSKSVKRGSALSCLTPSGRIFYPRNGRNANPSELFSVGLDGSYRIEQSLPYESFSCTLAPNGSVYCFSTNFNKVYKISFTYSGGQPQMFKESTLLSPLLNRG